MNDWKKLNETSLPKREDITNTDYKHAKKVSKNFKTTNLDQYHDLYVQSHALFVVS